MARIDEVKAACARLAGMGWQSLLKQHGLDIVKADLAAELARELTIDRSVPGPAPGQYSQRRRMGGSTEACRGAVSR